MERNANIINDSDRTFIMKKFCILKFCVANLTYPKLVFGPFRFVNFVLNQGSILNLNITSL